MPRKRSHKTKLGLLADHIAEARRIIAHWTNPLRGSSGTAATGELLIGSLLSERMWIVTPIPLKTGVPDGYDEPSSPAHDRGHDDPQSVALDPAILYLRGREVQPPFQLSTGSARHGGYPCLSAASGRPEVLVVTHQSGGVRTAVLLRHHTLPKGGVRAHRRRQGAGEASADPQS